MQHDINEFGQGPTGVVFVIAGGGFCGGATGTGLTCMLVEGAVGTVVASGTGAAVVAC